MKCIFIGGADRSGTTMLASLLSKIERSVVTPESLFKSEVESTKPFCKEHYCQKLQKHPRFCTWGVDIELLKKQNITSYEDFYRCLIEQYNSGSKFDYWIDHSPNNMAYSTNLDSLFSNCYFIHIVRDGRAVAFSQTPLEWGANTYLAASKAWLNNITYGFITESLFPERTLLVKYEDLLLNSEKEIARILKFLGTPETVSGKGNGRDFLPEFSKNQHKLVGKEPDQTRANAWLKKMTPQDIADFQYYATRALGLLGYEVIDTHHQKVTKTHIFLQYIKEIVRKKIINPRRYHKSRNKY
ncbi:sulfotransferase [Pseudoalteromonas distincta]|uniref:sulfotransferase family protein n=1 Tax=Pseudoalteromonas distincta TaxID=77608 RepID=UPI00352DD7B4